MRRARWSARTAPGRPAAPPRPLESAPGSAAPVTIAQPLAPYLPLHPHQSTTASGRPTGPNTLDVTIVLPCYNEQEHVLAEIDRISTAMDGSGFSYELLVI